MTEIKSNRDWLGVVRGLLAKAEAEGVTPAEAEALTAKATTLMAKHGIDEALAAAKADTKQKPANRIFDIQAPYTTPKALLLDKVAQALGCQTIVLNGRDRVHVFGFGSDIEMVDLLFTSLLLQSSHGAARIQTVRDHSYTSRTRSARSSYLLGFNNTVGPRLLEAYSQAKAEAEATTPGTDLVLASRDVAVRDALSEVYPKTKKFKVVARNRSGYESGQVAGRKANIHNRPETGQTRRTALR